jgi:CTP synthase
MQCAVIEFARNVLGLENANSTEFAGDTPHPVICLLNDQRVVVDKGGTMRLGAQACLIEPGTHAMECYDAERITERHRHRYEFNPQYRERFSRGGMQITGTSPDGSLAEIVELTDHPWFLAVQYHPEFKSKPNRAHPLFTGFVEAALAFHQQRMQAAL